LHAESEFAEVKGHVAYAGIDIKALPEGFKGVFIIAEIEKYFSFGEI